MPRLTASKVRSARHPGGNKTIPIRLLDGDGLYLQVSMSNAKSRVYRFKLGRKEGYMGLGTVDADGRDGLSLADARGALLH
jgi:hypothetical protein